MNTVSNIKQPLTAFNLVKEKFRESNSFERIKLITFVALGVLSIFFFTTVLNFFLSSNNKYKYDIVQERDNPPIDRIYMGKLAYKNKGFVIFEDSDIIEKLNVRKNEIEGVNVYFSVHNRSIILQQSKFGCTYATSAMILTDHKKEFNINTLRHRGPTDENGHIKDFTSVGLHPIINKVKNLEELEILLNKNGSCIVTIGDNKNTRGGHVIIVDAVINNGVRLRDPYHGWEITVKNDAFMKVFCVDENIIQIK